MPDISLTACGWAKLILFGEHAVVCGYPGLGMNLPLALTLKYESAPESDWSISPALYQSRIKELLKRLEQELGIRLPAGRLNIESAIPLGCGFGSSAALCTALVRLGCLSAGLDRAKDILWQAAHNLEKFFHGKPSGIDTGLSLINGIYAFHPRAGGLPDLRKLVTFPLFIVTGAVPRAGSTKGLVARVQQSRKKIAAEHKLTALGNLSEKAISCLAGRGSSCELGELARQAHHLLRALGLSNARLDSMLSIGQRAGAVGGKLSGGGGGGAFFLICENEGSAQKVHEVLLAAAADIISRQPQLAAAYQIISTPKQET